MLLLLSVALHQLLRLLLVLLFYLLLPRIIGILFRQLLVFLLLLLLQLLAFLRLLRIQFVLLLLVFLIRFRVAGTRAPCVFRPAANRSDEPPWAGRLFRFSRPFRFARRVQDVTPPTCKNLLWPRTTPRPLNSPGLASPRSAAFHDCNEARNCGLRRAASICCVCAGTGPMCRACSAASSAASDARQCRRGRCS